MGSCILQIVPAPRQEKGRGVGGDSSIPPPHEGDKEEEEHQGADEKKNF